MLSLEEARKQLHEKDEVIRQLQHRQLQHALIVHTEIEWPDLPLQGKLLAIYTKLKNVASKCIDYKVTQEMQQDLFKLLQNFMKELEKEDCWNTIDGFSCSQQTQQIFFIIVNQLLRLKAPVNYCPVCCREKRKCCDCRENCCTCGKKKPCNCTFTKTCALRSPKSHIWPNCVLLAYRDMNRSGIEKYIIMDLTKVVPKVESPENMCLKMLCGPCEKQASQIENKLSKIYRYIQHDLNAVSVIDNNDNEMKWIFALILLRGLLVNVNFLKELTNDDLYHTLHDLLDFCNNRQKGDLKRKLFLFMLPKENFRPDLEPFLRLFELNLRSPYFTSVCKFEDGSYLYTKLDCFHCVYPLDDKCADFLENRHTHTELDIAYRPYISLSSKCPKMYFPPSNVRKRIFPVFLLDENTNQTMKLMKRLLQTNSNLSKHLCKCISFIKLGQSSSMSMTGYEKKLSNGPTINDLLLKSKKTSYGHHGSDKEEFEFLYKCTESAAMNSYIGTLPFGVIDPHIAMKYIKMAFKLTKLKERLSKWEESFKTVTKKESQLKRPVASQQPRNLTNAVQHMLPHTPVHDIVGEHAKTVSAIGKVEKKFDSKIQVVTSQPCIAMVPGRTEDAL